MTTLNNTEQADLLKKEILHKTHYGLTIYSHILQQYYPGETVMHVVGRDCGLCRNPFNSSKKTLHIYIEKENIIGNSRDKETARHSDTENAIPPGTAFHFAELHYKQKGAPLLQTLNKELHLHIGEEQNYYKRLPSSFNPPVPNRMLSVAEAPNAERSRSIPPLFSFFKAPITNTIPHKNVTLRQIHNAITGTYYKTRTDHLRNITNPKQARQFKAANFDYCTFSGTFTTRSDKALITHSGLLCIDFDHLNNVEILFNRLLKDDYFDTQLLFRSPSGTGLKWIIPIDPTSSPHSDYFSAIANYILQTYNIEVDKSGRDLSRACFLPHDPEAYINPSIRN